MANRTLTVEQIIERGEREGFTAYQIAKLINVKLDEAGIEKIRPQMIYNYDRQGLVVPGTKNVTAERTFTREEVEAFVTKYVERKIAKGNAPKAELVDCFENVDEIHEELEAERTENQLPLEV